jgi:hypothetical protein
MGLLANESGVGLRAEDGTVFARLVKVMIALMALEARGKSCVDRCMSPLPMLRVGGNSDLKSETCSYYRNLR